MADLFPRGIAVSLCRDNDLLLKPEPHSMRETTDTVKWYEKGEEAVRTVLDADQGLVERLSAPERLLARDIRKKCGVSR